MTRDIKQSLSGAFGEVRLRARQWAAPGYGPHLGPGGCMGPCLGWWLSHWFPQGVLCLFPPLSCPSWNGGRACPVSCLPAVSSGSYTSGNPSCLRLGLSSSPAPQFLSFSIPVTSEYQNHGLFLYKCGSKDLERLNGFAKVCVLLVERED